MNRSRDKPGKSKAAIRTAFFVRKKRKVCPETACKTADRNLLERVRKYLYEIMIEAETERTEKTREEIYLQIEKMLHGPMLIWRNGVCYESWAECLESETSYSSKGDTVASPFLMEETDEL